MNYKMTITLLGALAFTGCWQKAPEPVKPLAPEPIQPVVVIL